MLVRSLSLLVLLLVVTPPALKAAPPQWWYDRGVIDQTQQPNDYAAVNQGQVKFIAEQAAAEMDAHLPGGAGGPTGDIQKLLDKWDAPTATTNDFTAVNLGQLKALAQPFYDRLIYARYTNTYPWNNSLNQANDYAAANIGQVKNLFSFDLMAVTPANDLNDNEIADWWEQAYNLPLGFDPNAIAPRGDMSYLQAFQQGLNPNDYYNGHLPYLSVVSGTPQTGSPGAMAPLPLVVQVTDANGIKLINAPIQFQTTTGMLLASQNATSGSILPLRTNSNGQATAFFQIPNNSSATFAVYASVSSNDQTVQATFTITSDDGTDTYPSPFDLVTTSVFNADASSTLSWAHHLNGVTGFTVSRSNNNGGSWTQLAALPAISSGYTVAASQQGVIGYSLFKVQPLTNSSSNTSGVDETSSSPIPTVNKNMPPARYAVIDLGLTDDVGYPEQINNNGTVLLVTDSGGVRRWRNGQVEYLDAGYYAPNGPEQYTNWNLESPYDGVLDDQDNVAVNRVHNPQSGNSYTDIEFYPSSGSPTTLVGHDQSADFSPIYIVWALGIDGGRVYGEDYYPYTNPGDSRRKVYNWDGAWWSPPSTDNQENGSLSWTFNDATGEYEDHPAEKFINSSHNGVVVTNHVDDGVGSGIAYYVGDTKMEADGEKFGPMFQNSQGALVVYDENDLSLSYASNVSGAFNVLSDLPFQFTDVWGFNALKIVVTDSEGNSKQEDVPH